MFFIVVYPLSVALVPTFVSGSFIFFLGSFVWVYFGKPVYSFEAIVFMLCIIFGPLFPRIFACLCGPLLRFSAFAISAFPFCFLGSIVRLFLRLPV